MILLYCNEKENYLFLKLIAIRATLLRDYLNSNKQYFTMV